jgi:hypothetical protein
MPVALGISISSQEPKCILLCFQVQLELDNMFLNLRAPREVPGTAEVQAVGSLYMQLTFTSSL